MDDVIKHTGIGILFIPYTVEAIIKNKGLSYTEFLNKLKNSTDIDSIISKYDLKALEYCDFIGKWKLLGDNSLAQKRFPPIDYYNDIKDAFLNNINMSINMDINDSIRFHVEDSVLYVILNKGFFYFLDTDTNSIKDFFISKSLLTLFNFYTEDKVLCSDLYLELQNQLIYS